MEYEGKWCQYGDDIAKWPDVAKVNINNREKHMNKIEMLGCLIKPSKSELGGKIYWLDYLKKKKFNIPRGYCINKKYFQEFMFANDIAVDEYVQGEIFKYDKIRSVIYSANFTTEMMNELQLVYDDLKKPIVVRSSSSVEDSEDFSCAGLFTSVNGVNSFEKFLEALKICWISTFNDVIDQYIGEDREYGINVLVQEEIKGEAGGVAFSIDPISQNVSTILIESCVSGPQAVVEGNGEIEDIQISRFNDEELNPLYKMIKDRILEIEPLVDNFIDMEWIYKENEVYIVQVRPVTTVKDDIAVIEVDDEKTFSLPLKNLQKMHSRWLEKKIPVRKVCIDTNINIGKFYYWFRKKDPNGDILKEVIDMETDAEVYEIYDGKDIVLTTKDNIIEKTLASTYDVLRVSESVPTEYSGFSSMIDDTCYIEVVKGGFNGFYSGEFESTKYVVDKAGNIINADEKVFNEAYYYEAGWWTKKSIESELVKLDAKTVKDIIYITEKLNEAFENVRVEWILNSKGVYLFDVTVEKEKLVDVYGEGKVISQGKTAGKAYVLQDAHMFDDKIKHISIRMGYEMDEIINNEEVKEIKEKLNLEENSILVCEYPNAKLSVLLDKVNGVIFERGSLLCHLAIILREKKIPAVIYPNAREKFANGDEIEIVDGKISSHFPFGRTD